MYRPTVRYNPVFKDYVEALSEAVELDKNQIFRLALFHLANSEEGQELLRRHSKTSLPFPVWSETAHGLWLENQFDQSMKREEEAHDVKAVERPVRTTTRRTGQVHEGQIVTGTGIRINIAGNILLPRR